MKRVFTHADDPANVDMTPMLDIVFIMLIFFIVTSVIIKTESLSVLRPSAVTTPLPQNQNAPIVLRIDAEGQFWLDEKTIDPRLLIGRLQAYSAGTKKPSLIINAHDAADIDAMINTMDKARMVGIDKISVASYH